MFTRRRYHLRAGFLLACSLTLGCQSVGPGAVVTPHAAVNPGRGFATAPTIVVRSTPPEGSAFRQVAYWRADGEPATQWRPVQRPAETAGAGGWWTTPHPGDAARVSMPTANGAPPAVLSEAVLTPAAGMVWPQSVLPGVAVSRGHPPFPPGPPAVRVPPGHAPIETNQVSLPPYRIGPPDILL